MTIKVPYSLDQGSKLIPDPTMYPHLR